MNWNDRCCYVCVGSQMIYLLIKEANKLQNFSLRTPGRCVSLFSGELIDSDEHLTPIMLLDGSFFIYAPFSCSFCTLYFFCGYPRFCYCFSHPFAAVVVHFGVFHYFQAYSDGHLELFLVQVFKVFATAVRPFCRCCLRFCFWFFYISSFHWF